MDFPDTLCLMSFVFLFAYWYGHSSAVARPYKEWSMSVGGKDTQIAKNLQGVQEGKLWSMASQDFIYDTLSGTE